MNKLVTSLLTAALVSLSAVPHAAASTNAAQPALRPPNGTYLYSLGDGKGQVFLKSTIVIEGSGATFDISERTKLPNGAVATTRSIWSSATLLPLSFELHQGKVALHAQITPEAVKFTNVPISFARMRGTSYILPSVGLIAASLMLPYAVYAHPGESLTLAEIQNNQTVFVQPNSASPSPEVPAGDMAFSVIKDKEHGNSADQEQIVAWVNRKTGIMDGGRATPGYARITLLSFKPDAPASAPASTLPSPGELYAGAIARLESLPQKPYISYVMTHSQTHNGKPVETYTLEVVERRADRRSWNKTIAGTLRKVGDISIGRHYLVPDAFLPYRNDGVPQGALPGIDLRTIASVHSVLSYKVTMAGYETLEDCGPVAHLSLTPLRDPQRYNVRDMWVRASDFRLCRAVFASRLYRDEGAGASYPSIDTVDLDSNGLITSYSLVVKVHYLLGTYAMTDNGAFLKPSWESDEPAYLFDYGAWKASGQPFTLQNQDGPVNIR